MGYKNNLELFKYYINVLKREYGFKGLYHFTDFENLKNIFDTGYLYSRSFCKNNNIKFQDGANHRVLDRASYDIHNKVRFYYRAKTPTLYDNEKHARGTEKEMVDAINNINLLLVYKEIGISQRVAEKILESRPIERFWHISNIKGVTSKSYENLFNYFYSKSDEYIKFNKNSNDTDCSGEQLSLF